jgi:hypothetical protein
MSCSFAQVVGLAPEDRETVAPFGHMVVSEHEPIDQMIQGRSELPDDFAENDTEHKRDIGNLRNLYDILSGLLVVVTDGIGAYVFVEKRLESLRRPVPARPTTDARTNP